MVGNRKKRILGLCILLVCMVAGIFYFFPKVNWNPARTVGEPLDSLNGVKVYYNGGVGHIEGRTTVDGYNLGLKYQCVEFVKRYYYEHLQHKMPDAYGHAKDFFDHTLSDGAFNDRRGLFQYNNPGKTQPRVDDLVIFAPNIWNRFGHVAIVSSVADSELEIIQQNPGPFGASRETFQMIQHDGHWEIKDGDILGWLRKEDR